jgi:hypothetical protein
MAGVISQSSAIPSAPWLDFSLALAYLEDANVACDGIHACYAHIVPFHASRPFRQMSAAIPFS